MSGGQEEELRRLREELRAYGRSLDGPEGAAGGGTMAERVLARILAEQMPVPARRPSPVPAEGGAALGADAPALSAGIAVRTADGAGADPSGAGGGDRLVRLPRGGGTARPVGGALAGRPGAGLRRSGAAGGGVTAGRLHPVVPEMLGPPNAVSVGALPHGRSLVSLCWRDDDGRTIRLDQFPGRLDLSFTKTVREQPQWLDVGGQALWFPRPHVLTFWMIDAEGRRFTREERTAGPTLLWSPTGTVTLRLEGVRSRERALEIATGAVHSPSGV